MTKEEMELEKAIQHIRKLHKKARELGHLYDPVGWALYHGWLDRELDKNKRRMKRYEDT